MKYLYMIELNNKNKEHQDFQKEIEKRAIELKIKKSVAVLEHRDN